MNEEQIAKVLSGIQKRIPKNLLDSVIKEVKSTPTIEMVMNKALTLDSISDEKKNQIKTLIDAGEFSKTKFVENPKIAKMIDNFVAREINKEIKKGNLPHRSKIKDLPNIKKIYEKVHNSGN